MSATVDTAQLPAMLTQLRLPTIARLWPAITQTADRESWPATKTLAALFEHEIAERAQRRTARHLLEAGLPVGKTIDRFDFTAIPSVSKARVMALAEGDGWLAKGTNILLFGPPGVGKSPLATGIGHAMVDASYCVLFTHTTDLVQHLQAARQDLKLATAIEKLDKYTPTLRISENPPCESAVSGFYWPHDPTRLRWTANRGKICSH